MPWWCVGRRGRRRRRRRRPLLLDIEPGTAAFRARRCYWAHQSIEHGVPDLSGDRARPARPVQPSRPAGIMIIVIVFLCIAAVDGRFYYKSDSARQPFVRAVATGPIGA